MRERHLVLYHKDSDQMVASVWATTIERRESGGGWLLLNHGNVIAATNESCLVRDADTREEISEPLIPQFDTEEEHV